MLVTSIFLQLDLMKVHLSSRYSIFIICSFCLFFDLIYLFLPKKHSILSRNNEHPLFMNEINYVNNIHSQTRLSLFNSIPKLFHFIWISPLLNSTTTQTLTSEVILNIQTCMELHINWNYLVWTDHMVREEFPEFVDLLIAIQMPSIMSDVLRMAILSKHGGVYMDTDFWCLRNFERLLKNQYCSGFCANEESSFDNQAFRLISGGLIGTTPNHPVLVAAAREIQLASLGDGKPNVITGPFFWGSIIKRYNTSSQCIYVYNKTVFYPCHYENVLECTERFEEYERNTNVYAIHWWKGSWTPYYPIE